MLPPNPKLAILNSGCRQEWVAVFGDLNFFNVIYFVDGDPTVALVRVWRREDILLRFRDQHVPVGLDSDLDVDELPVKRRGVSTPNGVGRKEGQPEDNEKDEPWFGQGSRLVFGDSGDSHLLLD